MSASKAMAHPLVFRAADALRVLGPGGICRIWPRWLLRQRYLVLARELSPTVPRMSRLESMPWTVLAPEQLPLVRAINPALSEREIRRRLAAGQECLLFWHHGAAVYYRWDTTRPAYLPYLSTTVRPLEGDLFTVEAFTHPAVRGRGIHSLATSIVLRRAHERGLRRSITTVAWWNRPALRVAQDKAGRLVAGVVSRGGFGPWRSISTTGAIHLAAGELQVLELPDQARSAARPRPGARPSFQAD
jgi:hypothetical protein